MRLSPWLWALVLAGACGTQLDDGDPAGTVDVFVSTPNGARVTGNLFASKADVYLAALDAGPAPAPREYDFQVVDGAGQIVSATDPRCRRLRIGDTGRIEVLHGGIVDGVACPHNTGVDLLNPAAPGTTVGLEPFADSSTILDGAATYAVELFPADPFEGLTEPLAAIAFRVALPPTACGNGVVEAGAACDDGGCTAACEVE